MDIHIYGNPAIHRLASQYLSELCRPVAVVPSTSDLHSTRRSQLDVSRFLLISYGGRSFICVAATWNSLPDSPKDTALSLYSSTSGDW